MKSISLFKYYIKKNINNKVLIVFLILILVITSLYTLFAAQPWGDEINFHYPNSKNFSIDRVINPNSSYSSAYTPLPYALGYLVLLIKDTIVSLRLLNFFIFLLVIYFAYKLSFKITQKPLLLTLLFISNPYLIRSSFTYYMFNYGILFALAGIFFYFFSNVKYHLLISHLLLGLAVLCSQWMIIIFAALFLFELTQLNKDKNAIFEFIKSCLIKLIFLLPSVVLFMSWHGFTHPNFHQHSLHPTFEHFNGTLANWGFVTFLLFMSNSKNFLSYKNILFIIVFLPVLFISLPEHSSSHGEEVITGVAAQISNQIQNYFSVPYKLTLFIFLLAGILSLISILKNNKNNFQYFLAMILVSFLAAFTASTNLGASHIFLSIPFLIIYFQKKIIENENISVLITLQLYFTSIFYIFYHAYLVPKI